MISSLNKKHIHIYSFIVLICMEGLYVDPHNETCTCAMTFIEILGKWSRMGYELHLHFSSILPACLKL
jgi:hypothetical protein